MSASIPAPLLSRIRLETWSVVLWCATVVFGILDGFFRLPGEATFNDQPLPDFSPGLPGWILLAVTAGAVFTGSRLLRARPLFGYVLFLLGPVWAAAALGMSEFQLVPFLAPAFALYCVARDHARRTSATAASFALLVLFFPVTVRVTRGGNIDTAQLLAVALTVLVAWLAGDSAHQARTHAAALQAQAAQQAAEQAVTGERLRIAREMHDAVAHSIGIIALQAGAAARIVHSRPDRAREAMVTVEKAGRETLSGLRRMLGTLREAEHPAGGSLPLTPAQGLADLDRLAEQTTAAGVRVDMEWQGERRPLPPDIDLSAYRITQEALTNVIRHSGARSCAVTVEHHSEQLTLTITDSGRGAAAAAPTTPSSWGLAGMRERVALLHGEFSAAPRPEGGFRVHARIPLPAGVR